MIATMHTSDATNSTNESGLEAPGHELAFSTAGADTADVKPDDQSAPEPQPDAGSEEPSRPDTADSESSLSTAPDEQQTAQDTQVDADAGNEDKDPNSSTETNTVEQLQGAADAEAPSSNPASFFHRESHGDGVLGLQDPSQDHRIFTSQASPERSHNVWQSDVYTNDGSYAWQMPPGIIRPGISAPLMGRRNNELSPGDAFERDGTLTHSAPSSVFPHAPQQVVERLPPSLHHQSESPLSSGGEDSDDGRSDVGRSGKASSSKLITPSWPPKDDAKLLHAHKLETEAEEQDEDESHLDEDESVVSGSVSKHSTSKHPTGKGMKTRHKTTDEQLEQLEEFFEKNRNPTGAVRQQLAEQLKMPERSVQIWFQNRRV